MILGFSVGSVLGIVFSVGAVALAFWFLIAETQKKSRRPFSGHPLRPPGEHLRLRVDALSERLLTRLMVLSVVLVPMVLMSEAAWKSGDQATAIAAVATGTALMLGIMLWAWRAAKELRDYSLGFEGERAVGEELNRLMLDGCQVFHDLALAKRGNVDHVVVAQHAVFAVETKTKRKPRPAAAGQEDHRVRYTGSELVYPFGKDRDDLVQAKDNAAALANKLSRLTAEPVEVRAVLVLPGWYVERAGRGEVAVVNDHKNQLRAAILDTKAKPMAVKQRQRIIELLEEWSRESMAPGS